MDFNDYQELTKKTALFMESIKEKYPDMDEDLLKIIALSYCGLGLGESGEVQGKIKKVIRDQGGVITDETVKALEKELGDILWYVAQVSSVLGLKLGDIAEGNIKKLFDRLDRGTIKGSGDDR